MTVMATYLDAHELHGKAATTIGHQCKKDLMKRFLKTMGYVDLAEGKSHAQLAQAVVEVVEMYHQTPRPDVFAHLGHGTEPRYELPPSEAGAKEYRKRSTAARKSPVKKSPAKKAAVDRSQEKLEDPATCPGTYRDETMSPDSPCTAERGTTSIAAQGSEKIARLKRRPEVDFLEELGSQASERKIEDKIENITGDRSQEELEEPTTSTGSGSDHALAEITGTKEEQELRKKTKRQTVLKKKMRERKAKRETKTAKIKANKRSRKKDQPPTEIRDLTSREFGSDVEWYDYVEKEEDSVDTARLPSKTTWRAALLHMKKYTCEDNRIECRLRHWDHGRHTAFRDTISLKESRIAATFYKKGVSPIESYQGWHRHVLVDKNDEFVISSRANDLVFQLLDLIRAYDQLGFNSYRRTIYRDMWTARVDQLTDEIKDRMDNDQHMKNEETWKEVYCQLHDMFEINFYSQTEE